MTSEQGPYLFLTLLGVAALLFALTPLALAWLWARVFSPAKPGLDKNSIYECGLESKGDAWVPFRSEYYLYAIIFLVLDVGYQSISRHKLASPENRKQGCADPSVYEED